MTAVIRLACRQCGQTFEHVVAGSGRHPTYCSSCRADPSRLQGKTRTVRLICLTCGQSFSYERGNGTALRAYCDGCRAAGYHRPRCWP